jgi:hypothetical protein
MSEAPETAALGKSGWSVALTGTVTGNALLLALLAIPGFFLIYLGDSFKNEGARYVALLIGALLLLAVVALAIRLIWRQAIRPDGASPSITVQTGADKRIILNNPPDTLVSSTAMRELFRAIALGYDPNLCPDGKVVGAAAEGNVIPLSEEEKRSFIALHRAEVEGNRKKALKLRASESLIPETGEPVSDSTISG